MLLSEAGNIGMIFFNLICFIMHKDIIKKNYIIKFCQLFVIVCLKSLTSIVTPLLPSIYKIRVSNIIYIVSLKIIFCSSYKFSVNTYENFTLLQLSYAHCDTSKSHAIPRYVQYREKICIAFTAASWKVNSTSAKSLCSSESDN